MAALKDNLAVCTEEEEKKNTGGKQEMTHLFISVCRSSHTSKCPSFVFKASVTLISGRALLNACLFAVKPDLPGYRTAPRKRHAEIRLC